MRNVQVQVIPAKKPKMSSKSFTPTGKRRVAAYDDLWFAMVENVVVGIDGSLTFKFKNGMELKK